MKKHLRSMLEALIADDTDAASQHLHAYLASTTRKLVLGEMEEEDEKDDEDKDEKKEKKDSKKSKKDDKDDEDDDKDDDDDEDVKEGLEHIKGSTDKTPVHQGGADSKEKQYKGYRHNEKGEAYHKVPHKDDSEGYGHEKSKAAARKLKAESDSGASAKKGHAYKDKPHKDDSRKAKSEDKGRKGLKDAPKGTVSPDSDGKKENRRTDKAKGYHGKDRGGKDLG